MTDPRLERLLEARRRYEESSKGKARAQRWKKKNRKKINAGDRRRRLKK